MKKIYISLGCALLMQLTNTLIAQTGFCEVEGLNSSYYINDFSTSGGATNISNLNSGFDGYADNTSMIVSSFDGGPAINFSIDFDSFGGTYGLGIWVDWDNDSVFSSGEQMFVSDGYYTSFTGTFSVPSGTAVGSYRMRVMGAYNDYDPTDPCFLNADNGDIEDYTFEVIPVPSCLPVSDLDISGITTTSVDIAWTAGGSETNWDIEYGPAGFTPGTGTTTSSSTPTFSLGSLTPDTGYDFYVRADCGGGDYSFWVGPLYAFTGYCQVEGTNSSYYITDFTTTNGVTSNISNVNLSFNGYEDNTAMIVSSFEGAPAINYSINFSGGTYGLGIWVDWNDDLTFDATEEMFVSSSYEESFTGSFSVPSGAIVGQHTMRVMGAYNDYDPTDPCFLNIDNGEVDDYTFEVLPQPSCMPVTDLAITNQTSNSIDIIWTSQGSETSWDIEYGPAGFTPGTGTMTTSSTTTFSASPLTADTDYDFYVRANCGGDQSIWNQITGRTGYCVVTGSDDYAFINNFHTTGGATSNISNMGSDYSPNGYQDATSMVVSQFEGGPEINFDVEFGNGNYFGFGIWVDWNNDMMFEPTEQMFVSNDDYEQEFTGSFGVPSGTPVGTYRMRIMGTWDDGMPSDPCSIADEEGEVEDYTFEVVPIPSCLPVSDIVASNITTTSVDLVWTVNGSEGLWNIEWGPQGFTPGTGAGSDSAQSNDIVYTVNGLNPSTTYDLYIQANCGADSSYWTMVTFTTLCAPATLPWTENFDALQDVDYGIFPNCWVDEYSDWLTDDINQNNTYNTAPYSGDNFLAVGIFSDDYIWTPEFQLTAGGNYEFSFMWAGAGTSNWDGEAVVSYEQSSNDAVSLGDPFVESSDSYDETYRKVTYCFTPDSSGIYSFAIHVSNFSFFGGGYLTFDDFKLIERTGSAGTDGTANVCQTGGAVDLNDIITKDDQTGVWSFAPNPTTIESDSLFNPQFVPSGTVYVNYITTGCMIDTATAIVTIYGPSMAGDDGSISACKNQPLDLLSGLNGTVTTGGDWYDPSSNQLPSSQITTGNFIGSFNYNYITGNGVCPDDTSLVVVTITNCNWLAVGENEMEGINVYPNPSTGLVYIESTFSTGSYNLVITDVNGRIVDNKNNTIVAGTNAVNLENVERGVYFFKLSNSTAEKVYRVVIE